MRCFLHFVVGFLPFAQRAYSYSVFIISAIRHLLSVFVQQPVFDARCSILLIDSLKFTQQLASQSDMLDAKTVGVVGFSVMLGFL